MSDENATELYRQLRNSQDKYAYFLLAAAGAAIAFAVTQTQSAALSVYKIPLGLAVISWALSFFFGCKHIGYVNSTLYANFALFQIEAGQNPAVGNDPYIASAAREGLLQAMQTNTDRASRFARYQFYALITGASLYIVWHVLEMALRTWCT